MAPSSSSSAGATSVQVALRIRPPTNQDSTSIPVRFQRSVIQATSSTSVTIEPPSSALASAGAPSASASGAAKKQQFTFDQVHGPPTTQYEMFETTAKPLITRFTEGFNCTILAYGQTSSGKTFTMTGADLDADPSDPHNNMGIIPRAVSHIFSRANRLKEEKAGAWTYNIKASFIEIYNEDLIDLFSMDDLGGRRDVQIREDKHGHIIWDGLREVNVRNANEVMGLLRKGTSIRRTNETDMNAQSSRSHAIFSLTLTQKKYTGSTPPRSHSPLPPGGRSPSRLARPGSMYANAGASRVASPTHGRPSTPSFASAMNRGGLRPASALGHAGDRSGDDDGEWITVTSKFHFVDLAGSERLKRTAAQGERIKEGISINSGLLALGNVISALGDPARAKSTTYIPYRDSKLTRLLQDSLGGNAHTLMIACVSPAEWNAGETINTLKYANRARNIKNRAVVNEKEEGWDDVEWLQNTILRMRKELKALKEGGTIPVSERDSDALEAASNSRLTAQMTELQNNYEDLRVKFVERTEELTRLRRELGEKQRSSSGGNIGGTAKYEEIVGPVIEEYEKTISAMEAELSLNRAALRHTNDLVEEKEEELAALSERHTATELYVEELRNRVAKLSEREASTEAYIRDLEEKMKAYDETSLTSSESLSDLKKELARYKDVETHSSKYIADLEARLAKSDESILSLQQTVERLEQECDRRRLEVETLQSRLDTFTKDGESWRSDLEERERRVKLLEEKMIEWEKKKNEAGEARARLGEVVDEVVSARKSLELDIANVSPAPSVITPVSESPPSEGLSPAYAPNLTLEAQLLALQQTHTATLADLSSITAKYRDALREISDLAAQIQEAKISNSNVSEADLSESPVNDLPPSTPPPSGSRRRMTASRGRDSAEPQSSSSSRRLFFRHAASTESLHASLISRPSLSISMPSLSPTTNERSVSSLEKEIMRLQEVLKERETEITLLEESLKASERREKELGILANGEGSQLERNGADSDALSGVLSPKTLNQFDNIRKTMTNGNGHAVYSEGSSVQSEDDSLERLNELMLSMAAKESQHRETVDDLTSQLTETRRQLEELTVLSRDQTLNMSTELEVLRKKHDEDILQLEEVQKREAGLVKALEEVKANHVAEMEELRIAHETALRAKAEEVEALVAQMKEEHTSSLAAIRADHEAAIASALSAKGADVEERVARMVEEHQASVTALRAELEASTAALQKARDDHEAAFGLLKEEHEKALQRQVEEAKAMLEETKDQHEKALAKLQADHAIALRQKEESTAAAQQTTEEEYYNALTKLRVDHAEAIKQINQETAATIERLKEEHASELKMAEIARQGSLDASESSRDLAIKELQDEHAAAIARKESAFTEECETLKASLARELATKEDDHRLQLDRLRLEHETVLSKIKLERRDEEERLNAALASEREQRAADQLRARKELEQSLQDAKEQQAVVLREVEKVHEEELAALKANHELAITEAVSKVEAQLADLRQSHATEVETLKTRHDQQLIDLNTQLATLEEEHRNSLQETSELRSRLTSTEEQHQRSLEEASILQEHLKSTEEERMNASSEANRIREQLALVEEDHKQAIQQVKDENLRLLEDERARHAAELEALEARRSQELEVFKKEQDSLVQELEAHKAAADEFTALRQQAAEAHERELGTKDDMISTMQQQLTNVSNERDDLEAEVSKLRAELESTRNEQSRLVQEASKRESLVVELERHRSVLAELQENLQKVKDEKDVLQTEKSRSDHQLRELQAQLARSASPPNIRSPTDRALGYPRGALPSIKLPPPTPPPTVPPPPAPRGHVNGDSSMSTSSQSSSAFYSSTRESQPESPVTSVGHTTPLSMNGFAPIDPKIAAKLEEQTKQIEEQEAMIKTLNKQLTHCETDLQTHMDLVAKLEGSLGDAEKNLRKARMQATELARERDTLNTKLEQMRNELAEAQREVVTVRRSVVEEKQSLEQRLDEERRAKERVRQQLDSRMEELQRRKSKFACL
ncbi:kinesin [Coprinopsis cinerea okayama7|uniref:Kinesin n=1 Tax=Coprinopsis cinerea (strain Okayama-7 / 130 / ATCC MYA-4618 / FGSC 9003) TaxID=240176 RepID=A8NEI3_COPC7|nr:kinesin [Coprinopsis cinerea okayama7\|eukprot:XP_001833035.2 kinesin [Coprinopsis cinerea okayama7\